MLCYIYIVQAIQKIPICLNGCLHYRSLNRFKCVKLTVHKKNFHYRWVTIKKLSCQMQCYCYLENYLSKRILLAIHWLTN